MSSNPAVLLSDLERGLQDIFASIQEQLSARTAISEAQSTQLNNLTGGFEKLLQVLEELEQQANIKQELLDSKSITELGGYAFTLLQELQTWCAQASLDCKNTTDQLGLGFAIWTSGRGGKLFNLEPIVDAIAALANQTLEQQQLQHLFHNIMQILLAVDDSVRQDLEKTNPFRPWRILNINAGIIATRTHDPDRMEIAFGHLLRNLPEDAPGFFSEGMEQMDKLDYPAHVRAVMSRYHGQTQGKKSLH